MKRSDFPEELLLNIFTFTDNKTKFSLTQVSFTFRRLSYLTFDKLSEKEFDIIFKNDNLYLFEKFYNNFVSQHILSKRIYARNIYSYLIKNKPFVFESFNDTFSFVQDRDILLQIFRIKLNFWKLYSLDNFHRSVLVRYPEALDIMIEKKKKKKSIFLVLFDKEINFNRNVILYALNKLDFERLTLLQIKDIMSKLFIEIWNYRLIFPADGMNIDTDEKYFEFIKTKVKENVLLNLIAELDNLLLFELTKITDKKYIYTFKNSSRIVSYLLKKNKLNDQEYINILKSYGYSIPENIFLTILDECEDKDKTKQLILGYFLKDMKRFINEIEHIIDSGIVLEEKNLYLLSLYSARLNHEEAAEHCMGFDECKDVSKEMQEIWF